MPPVVDDVASLVEQLSRRIAELEARVAALEHPSAASSAPSVPVIQFERDSSAVSPSLHIVGGSGNVVPVLGKAVLAMAGAYLLRAIAEASAGAQFPMAIAGILYASGWMAWAVRAHRTNHFASAAYGTTATVILGPLLFESAVRFQLLSVSAASVVLGAFVVLVLVLAWHNNLQVLPWIATLASIATILALIVATHELVPLTLALLGIALATEIAACLGHRLSLWAMVAMAADAAIALFVYVMTAPDGVPSSYIAVSAATTAALSLSLLGIYGGGIAIRSFGVRKRISNFEVLQGAMVFALSYLGTTRASQSAAAPLGVLFLGLACVCYWGALWRFGGEPQTRNRVVSASWAVLLMLSGITVTFPAVGGATLFCLLGISATLVHRGSSGRIPALHTSLYLLAAAAVSPFFNFVAEALAGTVPSAPPWTVWMVLASVLLCYCIAPHVREKNWRDRMVWIVPAVLASLGIAAVAVVALRAGIAARFALTASHIAGIRTIVTCLMALTLALLASRLRRSELGWLAYGAVGLGALKLLFEDLRLGNAASLVVSFLFYGMILILLPRLLKSSRA